MDRLGEGLFSGAGLAFDHEGDIDGREPLTEWIEAANGDALADEGAEGGPLSNPRGRRRTRLYCDGERRRADTNGFAARKERLHRPDPIHPAPIRRSQVDDPEERALQLESDVLARDAAVGEAKR